MSERDREKARFLRSLNMRRSAAFRSEVVPYFRYVVQSGFGLVVSAALFALLIGYVQLLKAVPSTFPAGYAGGAAIALAAMAAPLRTHLLPADPVFLLAMESSVLREYIRPGLYRSMTSGALRTLAVYAFFVPLYLRAPVTEAAASTRSVWALGLSFAVIAAWNAYGGWRERQIAYASRRWLFRVARCAVTLLSVGGLLLGPLLPALAFALFSLAIVTVFWALPKRFAMPWGKLIAEEAATRRRWHRFLGWFVDLPTEEPRASRRRWAAWVGGLLPWERGWAWRYLYALTFIRSDTFGALMRWYAVIGLIVLAVDHAAVDWLAYGVGVFVGGVQLTELGSWKWSASLHTLPLAPEDRREAASAAARAAGIAASMLLWLLAAIRQGWPLTWSALAALAAGLLWNGAVIPRRIRKPREEEED